MDVMETTGAVTPNGETLWSVETVGAALKDARDRGLVILCGDVFDEKMRETVDNWCYQPVWTPSYSEFSKTSSENSFRRAAGIFPAGERHRSRSECRPAEKLPGSPPGSHFP